MRAWHPAVGFADDSVTVLPWLSSERRVYAARGQRRALALFEPPTDNQAVVPILAPQRPDRWLPEIFTSLSTTPRTIGPPPPR